LPDILIRRASRYRLTAIDESEALIVGYIYSGPPIMTRHLLIVATAFRVTGLTMIFASILALVDLGGTAVVMRNVPPDTSKPLDIGTYGLIALIDSAARGFAWAMRGLAGVAGVIMVVLVIAAVTILLLGVLFYFTGRGVSQHADWARIVAVLISAGFALLSCSVMAALMTTRRDLVPFAALPTGFSLYSLWVLIWRFA
jgi:hypothetical protein